MKKIYGKPLTTVESIKQETLLDTSIHDDYGEEQYSKEAQNTHESEYNWGDIW